MPARRSCWAVRGRAGITPYSESSISPPAALHLSSVAINLLNAALSCLSELCLQLLRPLPAVLHSAGAPGWENRLCPS